MRTWALMEGLVENAPSRIANLRGVAIKNLDGVKSLLDAGSWLLIRPSGTERIVRACAEARRRETVQGLRESVTRLFDHSRPADLKEAELCAA